MELELVMKELQSLGQSAARWNEETAKRIADLEGQVRSFAALAEAIPALRSDVDAAFDRIGREARTARFAAIAPRLPGQAFADEEQARAFAQWYRNCAAAWRNQPLPFGERTLTPETATAGGFLIPDTFVPEILRIVAEAGVLQSIARRVPLGPGRTRIPKRASGVTSYWVAAGGTITPSNPTFSQVVMEPEKIAALVVVDNEMDDEAAIDLGNFLAFEMAYSLAKEQERVLVKGTGKPSDGGIIGLTESGNVTDVTMGTGDTAFNKIAWADLVDLECAVVNAALPNARYVLSRSVLGLIKKLVDDEGRTMWMPPAGSEPPTINGYPYTIVDQMPTNADSGTSKRFVAFGDFQQGLFFGTRRALRVDRDASAYFTTDQTAFRVIQSVDGAVVSGSESGANPIAMLKTAAS